MSLFPVSKARTDMKDLVNRVAYGKERVYLTSHDKKMVAMVPIEDLEAIEALENAQDIRIAEKRLLLAETEGFYSIEELRHRLGVDV